MSPRCIYVCSVRQSGTDWRLPVGFSLPWSVDSVRRANCTQCPWSRLQPACPTSSPAAIPAHQCACPTTFVLNIDMYSSLREQQPQTSNTISNVKYNPLRSIPQMHVNHLKCYTCTCIHQESSRDHGSVKIYWKLAVIIPTDIEIYYNKKAI